MNTHLHVLKGCAPVPLANYLKALGILRLVGEQADPQARGWWEGERFCLLTKLSKEELEAFFLERYEPTPIFNPWGGRSGYYDGSPEKTARNALAAIEQSTTDRLLRFREAITVIRSIISEGGGNKPDSEESRNVMISRIRLGLRGSGSEWLDTVIADLGESFPKPALLGTGGNEGSGSYTAAFLAAVVECVVAQAWSSWITTSLWSDGSDRDSWDGSFSPPSKDGAKKTRKENVNQPFRQYMPSGEGSPWDLLLSFEGTIVIQSGVSRRSSTDHSRFLSSPFYFAPMGMGSGSSSEMDEYVLNKGRKNPGRGEQWFPLWDRPSTFGEVQRLFREGRCSTGRRAAKNPIDAARAICGLGASRGIISFLRYGYLQRDNLATHFAVPLGRILVRENSTNGLVDDLADWLDHVHRAARNKNAPIRLVAAHRCLADAVFAALTHDHTADRWQAILLAAADIEAIQATGSAIDAGPIPSLRPEWVAAVDDGSPEVRLALALGSAAAAYAKGRPIDPVRFHWLPLEPNARRFKKSDKRLVNDARVIATGRDPVRDLAALVERRLIESGMKGHRESRLVAARGCGARLDDLAQFLEGSLDIDKLAGLARAFMAIRWNRWHQDGPSPLFSGRIPDEPWLAIRLANLPGNWINDQHIPAEPRIVRLLMSGDSSRAIDIACNRLRSAGIRPPLQAGMTDAVTARLWAAALAFPIDWKTANMIAQLLDPRLKPKKGLLHA
ncbi:MAG: type I-U CRISPR-associated protein Csx17 [Candidatus Hydrogenedentes bacterium]|nr:type I-U CRISPR-associated protein Csx17 [Candidatus Hydrogenedentota bacterium]